MKRLSVLKILGMLFLLVLSSTSFTSTFTTKRMRANSIRINALEINKMEALPEEPPEEMTIVLDDRALNFDFDKSFVKPQYDEMLTNLKEFITKNDYEVTIVGHTDYIASNEYNMGLSKRRAEAVKAKLIELGLDPSRIVAIVPRGEEEPVADNSTTEGRAKNRRVEFKLVKRGSKGEANPEESRVIEVKKEEAKTEN
ncbi:OmpA family protein [Fusobacterium nucleatum]|nr:OmpA family protein [Fusobacterium nucleatum]WDF24756.1 OmpA family protein [Fusobacterium nucleatum]